jgi:hypothetical protein
MSEGCCVQLPTMGQCCCGEGKEHEFTIKIKVQCTCDDAQNSGTKEPSGSAKTDK